MKRIKYYILICLINIFYISCTSVNFPNHPKWLCSKKYACLKHPRLETPQIENELVESYDNSLNDKIYEDFPNEDIKHGNLKYSNNIRIGKILNGYKEGFWRSATYDYDTIKKTKQIKILITEEYFKRGLRDSVFRQFNNDSKIIYETTFKMGTGLWKEFHSNGKIYFEIQTKDGYFTDTLKLYDDKGVLMEKLLYKKDSLVYRENLIIDDNPTDNKR
jgi:antitoxin component YwqK of YwqJK toxin-antitoxin module